MDGRPPVELVVVVVALALAAGLVALGAYLAAWWAGVRSRSRNRVAQDGERAAEDILAAAGYAVVARQVAATWRVCVDGEAVDVGVRADLVVERGGVRYVAEVKTGERAPDPCFAATRRQLLEYSLAFGGARVLLVDVEAGVVHTVAFPAATAGAAAGRGAPTRGRPPRGGTSSRA